MRQKATVWALPPPAAQISRQPQPLWPRVYGPAPKTSLPHPYM